MPRRFAMAALLGSLVVLVGATPVATDKRAVKALNGIAFAEFEGYDAWPLIAPSQPDDPSGCGASPEAGCIKAILGNPAMMRAYADGVPADGRPVPDGAVMAKVEWEKHADAGPPYGAVLPGPLSAVSFMVKDAKRFPRTDGWGYATFVYDQASGGWTASGDDPDFGDRCHACHAIAQARDFVFTRYAAR